MEPKLSKWQVLRGEAEAQPVIVNHVSTTSDAFQMLNYATTPFEGTVNLIVIVESLNQARLLGSGQPTNLG